MTQTAEKQLNSRVEGNGEHLVFIHGWGLNSAIFSPMVDMFKQQFTVTCIDLPGFGDNVDSHLKDYSLGNLATAVADVIDQPSIVVGWSLGGLVASELALHHSDKVKAVVTITSSPYFVDDEHWPGIKPELLRGFHQQLAVSADKTISNFLRIQAMGAAHVRADIKEIKALIDSRPHASKETLDASLSLLETVDLRAKIQNIDIPFLRLYGRLDSLVPKAVIEQMDKLVPQSDSYTFYGASHAPFISHKDEFKQVLCDWISGIK
ncbi:pimeloyl-ACP methyl ester esterase BioH [Thalassotalea maritima]|uniref:pimeloyl-ACP methyl ester esterase BioH n=1 Tax=Thalassotalea maritima TaxID=3242416 RepID=UPI0035297A57